MSRFLQISIFIFTMVNLSGLAFIKLSTNHKPISSKVASNSSAIHRLPECIVIGVRKGGTRALLDMINLHSKVKIAKSEVHFFDSETNYQLGLDWYRGQMPKTSPGEIAIEKSPSYFVTEDVPSRIFQMNPHILLLLVLRDPVTRLVSDYTQIKFNHLEKGLMFKSFEDLVFLANQSVNIGYEAVAKSIYIRYIHRWLHYFPKSQLHIVNGDRLIHQPWQELKRVEKFLGLEPEIEKANFFFNSTKGFHCLKKRNHGLHCLTKSKGRVHPNITERHKSKLRQFYAPFNYQLYDVVERDFGWPEV
eukprot:snap_masked-scaffold1072_size64607-processed-gene-0.7 protein:Tk04383 transcript:snap_masked-scaffold1072_size64607-processed-gene-0.7-mRNA-1 annotation:"hypothetical protein DAPPUDRAFT_53873"